MKQKNLQKIKIFAVMAFILIYAITTYVTLRGNFLEYKELGENYLEIFYKNIKYKYIIQGISFTALLFIILLINIGIKKGLKPFFEAEKKEMPKLPNKSLAFIISAIVSVIFTNDLLEKLLLCISNVSFQDTDIVFNLDISYYMFFKPIIEFGLQYLMYLIIGLSAYTSAYYVLVFNLCFDAIDRELLKKSILIKKLLRNIILFSILEAIKIITNTQNILIEKFMTLENGTELIGAGFIESTIKLFGYIGFAIVLVISIIFAVKYFKKSQSKKVLTAIASIPLYLIGLFLVINIYNFLFVRTNEFDKEKKYIQENINRTQIAYDIDLESENIEYTSNIAESEITENQDVLNNIIIVNKNIVLQNLEDTQTATGYYTYRNARIAKYKIDGKDKLVYISPREIINSSISYNNQTYEYTHGIGEIVVSATNTTESGNIEYLQKSIDGDDLRKIVNPRIYYGLETNASVVVNNNKSEFDYIDENGEETVYQYTGDSGLQVDFIDRLILACKKGNFGLAFSKNVTSNSKILINRNIRERAKTALPYIMYDENPYTVVDENGNLCWVLDGYTASDRYPSSTYTEFNYEGNKRKINYIRNSIKVIINAYNGEMKFYLTDETDPIAMAYWRLYPNLFENRSEQISKTIQEQLIYPEFLYKMQAQILEVYHTEKADVLYRNTDIWNRATYNNVTAVGKNKIKPEPYWAIIKEPNEEKETFGLIQIYTPNGKSNVISYLVGTNVGTKNKLKVYKYSADSNILGMVQLNNQIEQDETISEQVEALNITGSKITKEMKIIPINNTILYVQTVYQTKTNEAQSIPTLKKVIVAIGNKVAIGDNIEQALLNLLSQSVVEIEIDNTEELDGIIEAIINANKNLNESLLLKDWEIMGSDIKSLQELINLLQVKYEQKQKEEVEKQKQVNDTLEIQQENQDITNNKIDIKN